MKCIKTSNLELTVNSVEEKELEYFVKDNYTIVNITLKNNNEKSFDLYDFECNLNDNKNEKIKNEHITTPDNNYNFLDTLEGNTTITANLYFKTNYKKNYTLSCGVKRFNKQKIVFETIDKVKVNLK